jgi:hypothetical protein
MPPIDDQRTQIVDTLRERYFPLIPQLLANWTPDQHDKNRAAAAYAAADAATAAATCADARTEEREAQRRDKLELLGVAP